MLASETDKHWKKGYISGTFDMFHIGHLNLIRKAKERCDYLVVGVLDDEVVRNTKGKWPVIPLHDRLEIISALKYTDETDITTAPLINKVTAWEKYRFDAMFSGDDHLDDGWAWEEKDLAERGVDLVFFSYTKKISTTQIKKEILPTLATEIEKVKNISSFNFIFPFDKVEKNERILIYGTGNVGSQYAAQLAAIPFCEIYAFADTYFTGDFFHDKPCLTQNELLQKINDFDRIIIASTTYHSQIASHLRALGINEEKFV
jgi:glycerol-3-phosphate cytidylyltransferase